MIEVAPSLADNGIGMGHPGFEIAVIDRLAHYRGKHRCRTGHGFQHLVLGSIQSRPAGGPTMSICFGRRTTF